MKPAHSQALLTRARVTFLPPRSVRLAVIVISLLTVPMPAEQSVPDRQEQASRPRVGLALGGGAARGLAHVGVLEWLEENRIPVDAIAGTSIGGLVGGGYATGRLAAELRAMVAGIDWNSMFRGDLDYSLKSFRRKQDRRGYPVRPEFGLRGGFRMSPSLDPGHEVELLLSRVALPYAYPLDFDDLPIPFRAVATDLEAAAVAELEDGSLAQALRATMAIPGVFQPVERDGLLLADGALLNNVPADVASRMGVDVVIAVDVGGPLYTRDEMQSLFSIASQAIGVMMAERTRSVLNRHADHVITPALDDVSAADWREFEAIRALGYEAAVEACVELAYLALSPAEWERHIEARQARRVPLPVEPRFVRVMGVEGPAKDELARTVEPVLGATLVPNELALRLTRLAGRGRYGSIGYDLLQDGDRTGIGVRARAKPHGPPFLNLAIELENRDAGLEVSLGTRLTVLDAGTRDAELRFELDVGPDAGARIGYYLPVGGSSLFVAPRVDLQSRRQRVSVDGDLTEGYRTRRALAGVDLGLALGPRSEFRAGYEAAVLDARVQEGVPLLRDIDGVEHGARVRWVYDGYDDWFVPRSGTRIETEARWLVTAPGQPSGFAQARLTSTSFLPVGRGGRIFLALVGSTASGDQLSPIHQSTLGGPFRLGAFERDELRGVRTGYAGTGYLRQLGRMPDLLGGPIYFGAWVESGWIEAGRAFPPTSHADLRNVSAGLLVDTLLGALFATTSYGSDGPRFHIGLGRPFW